MNNIPAFPRSGYLDTSNGTLPDGDEIIRHQDGMTLRDYFAAAAISEAIRYWGGRSDRLRWDDMATEAYDIADAMLEVRDK